MEIVTDIGKAVALLLSFGAVVEILVAPVRKRVGMLEKENTVNQKRSVADCDNLISKCPVQTQLAALYGTLADIKDDLSEMRGDLKEHVKYHLNRE